jgi:hypothetical protein
MPLDRQIVQLVENLDRFLFGAKVHHFLCHRQIIQGRALLVKRCLHKALFLFTNSAGWCIISEYHKPKGVCATKHHNLSESWKWIKRDRWHETGLARPANATLRQQRRHDGQNKRPC